MDSVISARILRDHQDHDARWMVPDSLSSSSITPHQQQQPHLCIACVIQMLEDAHTVNVKKKMVLSHFLAVFKSQTDLVTALFSDDIRVAGHVVTIALGLLKVEDVTFVSMAVEVIVLLVCRVKSEELVYQMLEVITQECVKMCNYKKSLPHLHLLGRMLQNIPPLAAQMLQCFGSLLDYISSGLSYSDESVRSSVLFILALLYRSDARTLMTESVHSTVSSELLSILMQAQHHDLLLNALALLKSLLNDSKLIRILMDKHTKKASLPAALKRMLLTNKDVIQITSVQCVSRVLTEDQKVQDQYASVLLDMDIAEFLFEILASSNDLLIGSIFCCLLLFCDSEAFFKKCHAIYGLESILRAIEQVMKVHNQQIIIHGFTLLAAVLQKQPSDLALFSNVYLVKQCASLITAGIGHGSLHIASVAAYAHACLLRKEQLPLPVPMHDLMDPVELLVMNFKDIPGMKCHPDLSQGHGVIGHHRGSRSQMTSAAKLQDRMSTMMMVIHKMYSLVEECSMDPLTNEATFNRPAPPTGGDEAAEADGPVMDAARRLMVMMDTVCLPLFFENVDFITKDGIIRCLFSCLHRCFRLLPGECRSMMRKLAETGLISLSLQVKRRFSQEDVDREVNRVLSEICYGLQDPGIQIPKPVLLKGCSCLQGAQDSLLVVLDAVADGYQAHLDAEELQAHQQTLLCLLYTAFMHGDKCIDIQKLKIGLDVHLASGRSTDSSSLKHLLYLFAVCNVEPCGNHSNPAVQRLLADIQQCETVDIWYTHSDVIFRWCFSSQFVSDVIGQIVMERWLKACDLKMLDSKMSDDLNKTNSGTDLARFICTESLCFQALLNTLTQSEIESTWKAVKIIKYITLQSHINREVMAALRECLPELLNNMFLTEKVQNQPIPENNQICLLDLLCHMKQTHTDSLSATDMKLLFHVTNLLVKEQLSSEKLLALLNLVNCLLIQSLQGCDSKVLAMIMSNHGLLRCVSVLLGHSHITVHSAASCLLALLLQLQIQHQLSAEGRIKVSCAAVIERLRSADPCQLTSSLLLLTNLCLSRFSSKICTISADADERSAALLSPACDLHPSLHPSLTPSIVRCLLICLQHCILHENMFVQQQAVHCLCALHQYVKEHSPQMAAHLLRQPWNQLLMEVLFEGSCQPPEQPLPPPLLKLCALNLQNRSCNENMGDKQMKLLIRNSLCCRDRLTPLHRDVLRMALECCGERIHAADLEILETCASKSGSSQADLASTQRWRQINMSGVVMAVLHEDGFT